MPIYAALSPAKAMYLTQEYQPANPSTWSIERIEADGQPRTYAGIEVLELTAEQELELWALEALVFESPEAFVYWHTQNL